MLSQQNYQDRLAIAIEAGIQNTGIAIFVLRYALPQPEADLTTIVSYIDIEQQILCCVIPIISNYMLAVNYSTRAFIHIFFSTFQMPVSVAIFTPFPLIAFYICLT